jgi:hypothetical protein
MRSSMELKERPSAKGFGDFSDARQGAIITRNRGCMDHR